jgi:deoxyribodipyrimidine photo-lyase
MSPHHSGAGVIYWFRNDLRLHDQPALQSAIELATTLQTWLLPVYIHDDTLEAHTPWGFARTTPQRNAWTQMAVHDLARQLSALHSQLFQLKGKPAEILQALSHHFQESWLVCEDIAAPYEQAHIQQLKDAKLKVQTVWQSTLMRPADLPFDVRKVPDQFTTFRQLIERPTIHVQDPLPVIASMPDLPDVSGLQTKLKTQIEAAGSFPTQAICIDPRSAFPWGPTGFKGGETSALAHLDHYCNSKLPSTYKLTRNGLMGLDYSTKWSPWLATGALSARQAWAAVKAYEATHGANDSTYWIGFELLWRDHFRWLHLKHGHKLYRRQGLSTETQVHKAHSTENFEAWCAAKTGHPFIDAGMRELTTTSYLSNRMRQNLASYLIHDLGCDWRAGAAWFETHLIDFDVYSNQGNWLYLSGCGTDPRGGRRFNPDKQAKDYDPDGSYRALWRL